MLAGLHGELFGRQPEGIEAHRVQHVASSHPLIAGKDVGSDESQRVTDVQAVVRRVREHVEDEQLLAGSGHGGRVGQTARRVRSLEDVVFLPPVLPAQFEVGGELGVVAEWWRSVASVRLRLL